MALSATHIYQKDSLTVYKMFIDEDYLIKKWEGTGAINIELLECGESGGKFVIKSQRDVPANPPGFAKKFLKSTNTVVEVDTWELSDGDVKKGTFEVDVKGTPIKLTGTMVVSPTKNGCKNEVEVEAKVSIPIIGGKIGKFIEGDAEKNLKEDYRFTKKFLDSYS